MLKDRDMRQANRRKVSATVADVTDAHNAAMTLRDAKGHYLPGCTPNPTGKSTEHVDYQRQCQEILDAGGWEELRRLALHASSERVRVAALSEIADRAYGRPSQTNILQGDADKPLAVRIIEVVVPLSVTSSGAEASQSVIEGQSRPVADTDSTAHKENSANQKESDGN